MDSAESVSHSVQCQSVEQNYNILLSTAQIKVKSPSGKIIKCKAFIDNAPLNSLISREYVEKLNLLLLSTSHRLIGINWFSAETCLNSTKLQFSRHFSNEYKMLNTLVVSLVATPLPNFRVVKTSWPHTQQLPLAIQSSRRALKLTFC